MYNDYFGELVIVGDKKLGIFNKKTCKYLTPKIYDSIILNNCGSHVVEKKKYFKEKDNKTGEEYDMCSITYIAIVKDNGTIIELPNHKFIHFDENIAITFSNETRKMYLIDCDGKKISKEFDRLIYIGNGLYYAVTHRNQESEQIKNIKLLNSKGKSLPFTFNVDKVYNPIYSKPKEIRTFNDFLESIKKYGLGIISVAFKNIKSISQLLSVINASIDYLATHKESNPNNLQLIIDNYKLYTYQIPIKLDVDYNNINIDLSKLNISKIHKNILEKQLMKDLIEPYYFLMKRQ